MFVKTSHTAEYYLFSPEDILSDYDVVRTNSTSITSNFECGASLETTAGSPGSLVKQDGCIIEFESERPAVWDLPIPTTEDSKAPGRSLLSDCDFNSCEFDTSDSGNAKTYQFVTSEGCLTSDGLVNGRGIKTRPCGDKMSQKWHVDEVGRIVSSVNDQFCFSKSGQQLVLDECNSNRVLKFGYNAFDKTLFTRDSRRKVISVGSQGSKRVKLVKGRGTLSEIVELV